MASSQHATKEEDEPLQQRPPSPPPHTTFEARGIHPPTFSALKPRDFRLPGSTSMNHVAWSCDGKKLAAVGMDKATRVWNPEKSIEFRAATLYTGGHTEEVDYISWNPTHPDLFCTSSQRDRRIVFWDARQSRYTQTCTLKVSPVQTSYSPNGRELMYISAGHQLFFMHLGRENPSDAKEQWRQSEREPKVASTGLWNHAGTGVAVALQQEHSIRALEYPSLNLFKSSPAHVGGVSALALDPRGRHVTTISSPSIESRIHVCGRYLASGGADSIVNLFDLDDWICARTITACEHSINALSFSYDGEYIAIANAGPYIDICATETGVPLHRVSTPAPAPTVAWHPSRYVIAYCGQGQPRIDGGPPPTTTISLFGLLE